MSVICTISINKKSVKLSPVQLSFYRQCQIIEAVDSNHATYYLFFIKGSFLHAGQLGAIPSESMLYRILSKGTGFSGNHPLTEALLPDNSMFHSIPLPQLIKKLSAKYGPLDAALYLTFFEGCVPAETLRLHLKKTFYYFRRNGQLLAAYKLLHYYLDLFPDEPFASDMLSNLSFQQYARRYRDSSMLSIGDSTFLEFLCFDRQYETMCFEALLRIYQNEGRWIDELASRCNYLTINNDKSNFQKIQDLIQEKFDAKQQTSFLQNLLSSISYSHELGSSVFSQLISQGNHTEAIRFLIREQTPVTEAQLPLLTEGFLTVDLLPFHPDLDKINQLLVSLYSNEPLILEPILRRFITSMFPVYELSFVKDWTNAFTEAGIRLPVLGMIENMESYAEDPDQQFALGKLYFYFHQYEKSIDCFKWEMELKQYDAEPIQYLIKVYAYLGEKEEQKAYTQMLHQLNQNPKATDKP